MGGGNINKQKHQLSAEGGKHLRKQFGAWRNSQPRQDRQQQRPVIQGGPKGFSYYFSTAEQPPLLTDGVWDSPNHQSSRVPCCPLS